MKEKNINLPDSLKLSDSDTVVFLLVNEGLVGSISLSDKIREESFGAIERLKKAGIKCWMLTGDNKRIEKKKFLMS
jgi:Cu2+-exporting ATPase